MSALLTPQERTTVPLGDATHTEAAIFTAARFIVERMMPDSGPPLPVTMELVQDVIELLAPWQPITKQGKLPKRAANLIHKRYNASLPDKFLATLGGYLASDIPGDGVTYAITKEFDWEQGEFGDKGSCFFTSSPDILPRLTLSSAHALRFYDKRGKGTGRAIILPSPMGEAVVVNSYGPSLEQTRGRLRIIKGPDTRIDTVSLTNFGDHNYQLYINLGVGLLVGGDGSHNGSVDLAFELPLLPYMPRRSDIAGCWFCGRRDLAVHMAPLGTAANDPHDRRHRYACNNCTHLLVRCALSDRYYPPEETIVALVCEPSHVPEGMRPNRLIASWYTRARRPIGDFHNGHVCDICGCHTRHETAVSIRKFKVEHCCFACLCEKGIDDWCHACGLHKRGDEECYCQVERERKRNARTEHGDEQTPRGNVAAASIYTADIGYHFNTTVTATTAGTFNVAGGITQENIDAALRPVQGPRRVQPLYPDQDEVVGDDEAGADAEGTHLP